MCRYEEYWKSLNREVDSFLYRVSMNSLRLLPPPSLLPIKSQLYKKLELELLPSILSSSPHWLSSPPDIRLKSYGNPKNRYSTYRQLINNIITSEFANHIPWFTDGSRAGPKTGYAYSSRGSITSHQLKNPTSIFFADFQVIFTCLSCLSHRSFTDSSPKFLLLTDSISSLLAIQDTYLNNPIALPHYHRFISNLCLYNDNRLVKTVN